MADCDAPPSPGWLGEVVGDRIVEAQPTVFGEHHDCRSGELLAHRSRLIDGAVTRQSPELYVGVAEAATEQHAVAPDNRQREAGNALAGQLGANVALD